MIFKKLQGITLLQAVAASMVNTFPKEPHFLQKNLNIIKSQLYGPWNNEKVNKQKW